MLGHLYAWSTKGKGKSHYQKKASSTSNIRVGGAELSGVFKKQNYDIVGLVFSGLFVFWIVCLFGCVCVCVPACVVVSLACVSVSLFFVSLALCV